MRPALGSDPVSSMSAALPPTGGALRIGSALATTFGVWRGNLVAFSALTLLAYTPLLVGGAVLGLSIPGVTAPQSTVPQDVGPYFRLVGPLWGATMLAFAVQIGALTSGVIQHLAGRKPAFGAMLGAGLKSFFPLVGLGVLCYLAIVLGVLLLVVPGIILAIALSVAIPALVAERLGVRRSMRRSLELTRGNRLAMFAVFLVIMAVGTAVSAFSSFLLPAATASFAPWLGLAFGFAVNVVFGTLYWVLPAVLYHQLRVAKEGVDTAQLAAVFD